MKFLNIYLSFILISLLNLKGYSQTNENNDPIFTKALSLKFSDPDSSAIYFLKGYEFNLKKKDTLKAINFLIEVSDLYAHNVNYGKSYDGYWEALLLAEKSKDSISTARVYQSLGWLYSFYKRDEEALKYFNLSLKIRKNLYKINHNTVNRYALQSDYFSVVNLYRVNKNYDKAKIYLDSCYQVLNSSIDTTTSYFLLAEKGFLEAKEGKIKESLLKLNECKTQFEKTDQSYLVIIHSLLGDVYKQIKNYDQSILNYEKSLSISHKLNRHLNYRLFDYQSLSDVYFETNNIPESYKYLKLAKERNEEIFGGQSKNNQHLLEIKDKYRIEKDRQQSYANEQKLIKLEHEDKISFLQTIILAVSIIFILLFGYVFVRFLRNKHKNEKRILREKQRLHLQKQNEILELKNKELTESALRLIEKDEFISGIKKKLSTQKDNIDVNVIKRMLKSIQGTPNSNWKEFEARFTTINQSFYNKLKTEHPQLSQTDQKICALVKLNFPSKDMAKLLGISVESVHTSRYRLRKKLGLDRKSNLEEFINQI